jgi:hypothetical protein
LDLGAADPTNKISKVTYNAAAVDYSFKAVAPFYTCAILASSNTKLSLVRFSANDVLHEDLITSGFVLAGTEAAAIAKSYQVADGCEAFSSDTATYHYDATIASGTKFVADSATTWTAPVFNTAFSFAAANDGLYKYNPKVGGTPGSYSRVYTASFLPNKRIWFIDGAIIVFSWASTGTADIKDYKVHSIALPSFG